MHSHILLRKKKKLQTGADVTKLATEAVASLPTASIQAGTIDPLCLPLTL